MTFVRRFGVVLLGAVLLISGVAVLAARDVVDAMEPTEGFEPLNDVGLEIATTLAGEFAFASGILIISVWLGFRLGDRTLWNRTRLVPVFAILVAAIALSATGASLANNDRGDFLVGGPASGIDYRTLAFILEFQFFQVMVVLGAAVVVGTIASIVRSRRRTLASIDQ